MPGKHHACGARRPALGDAVIQVDQHGQNAIIIHGGANRDIRSSEAAGVLAHFDPGDYRLLQNEISGLSSIIEQAHHKGLIVFLNPAPMDDRVSGYPLDKVDYFIVNEIEGRELTGAAEPAAIIAAMRRRFPRSATILTLGASGVLYADQQTRLSVPAEEVVPVDTTAAGDTFIGYFIAQKIQGETVENCLKIAARAAALCVTRRGAADSIPLAAEVITGRGFKGFRPRWSGSRQEAGGGGFL